MKNDESIENLIILVLGCILLGVACYYYQAPSWATLIIGVLWGTAVALWTA